MPGRPYEDTEAAMFISKSIAALSAKKSQLKIAIEAGFPNPNMLSMIKNGSNRVPFDRVADLAKALEVDPAFLLRLAMKQSPDDALALAILEIYDEPITKNERGWIKVIREASGDTDPPVTTRRRRLVAALFGGGPKADK